jgi:uncharacterized protein (TIGR00369 family)
MSLPPYTLAPFAQWLGIRLVAEAEQWHFEVDGAALPANRSGVVQGGLLATLLDISLAYSVRCAAPDCGRISTVNLDVHFLQPGSGRLLATATALQVGGTLGFARGAVKMADGTSVAVATGSFRIQRARDSHADV